LLTPIVGQFWCLCVASSLTFAGAPKGAYAVVDTPGRPDLILVANGSEVSLLVEGAALLKAKGLKVRVVSAPSEGLFREQTPAYQESVLPFGLPTLGWTAGEPTTLKTLVGALGKVYGMTRFGASAPFKVLDALACARPVVASDLPSVRPLLDSGALVLVPPDDPAALAEALRALLADPGHRIAIGWKGRGWAERHASWDRAAAALAEALERR